MSDIREGDRLYSGERVSSAFTYGKEYDGPRPIEEQIAEIAHIFALDPMHAQSYAQNLPKLPEGAEGWFAVPSVEAVTMKYPGRVTPLSKYYIALYDAFLKIKESRRFYDETKGDILSRNLRTSVRTKNALERIAQMQPGDILLIPAQLGMGHRGESVRCARESFVDSEFGLSAFHVVCILLTHPTLISQYIQLRIDCAGDEFSFGELEDFTYSPNFFFRLDSLRFHAELAGHVRAGYGSATGFVP